MTDHGRDLWIPYFEMREVMAFGAQWPDIMVEKWERNGLGETRYVDARMYPAPSPEVTTGGMFDVAVKS